ncbi:hypothetical protein cypCar_00033067 [Cyprinus carpio]|nr:hypothetical protein cypCar_00033067 [Cyprinus carpio]
MRRNEGWKWAARWLFAFSLLWNTVGAQIRYTIPEELKEGSIVGNIAKDLGFDVSDIAQHKGNPGLEGQSSVQIDIIDENDNPPEIILTSSPSPVPENATVGTVVALITVKDLDSDGNNKGNREMRRNGGWKWTALWLFAFSLLWNTTEAQIRYTIPEELKEGSIVGNIAKDLGFDISDIAEHINDNEPKFEVVVYKASVPERAIFGSSVIKMKATDLDEGPNGEIQYSFGAHTQDLVKNVFSVNAETGEITVIGKLDYETEKTYMFDVCAKDKGNPELEGQSSVQIDIIDENDNPPEIILTSSPSPVPENATVGTVVALITVKDLDSVDIDRDKNALLTYSVLDLSSNQVPASSYFYINSENGTIYSMSSFDYEKMKLISIVVQAKDHGSPSLSSNVTVHVFILDHNDNAPAVIYPSTSMGSVTHQKIPRSSKSRTSRY